MRFKWPDHTDTKPPPPPHHLKNTTFTLQRSHAHHPRIIACVLCCVFYYFIFFHAFSLNLEHHSSSIHTLRFSLDISLLPHFLTHECKPPAHTPTLHCTILLASPRPSLILQRPHTNLPPHRLVTLVPSAPHRADSLILKSLHVDTYTSFKSVVCFT